jgi:hypothetical protein
MEQDQGWLGSHPRPVRDQASPLDVKPKSRAIDQRLHVTPNEDAMILRQHIAQWESNPLCCTARQRPTRNPKLVRACTPVPAGLTREGASVNHDVRPRASFLGSLGAGLRVGLASATKRQLAPIEDQLHRPDVAARASISRANGVVTT